MLWETWWYWPHREKNLPSIYFRIEIQFFILHWMMQNIRLFNVGNITKLMFCIIQWSQWIMQNIRLFIVGDITKLMFCIIQWRHLKANVLHHPVQAKNLNFNPYIYILYYQSNIYLTIFHTNLLVILVKWNILFVTKVFEQPANKSPVHNVEAICE